jgi:hypothetical protein
LGSSAWTMLYFFGNFSTTAATALEESRKASVEMASKKGRSAEA